MQIRANYTRDKQQENDGINFKNEISLTKQQFKEECDINNILKLFKDKGVLPDMIKENPAFGDFSEVPDYKEALEIVLHAETQFGALPAVTRDRFENNPEKFLAFVGDPENAEEMVEMGLAIKREVPTTDKEAVGKPTADVKPPPPPKA